MRRTGHPVRTLLLWGLLLSVSSLHAQTPGDANADGQVDGKDIVAVVSQVLGLGAAAGNADCNSDGQVNILDITCIIRQVLMAAPAGGNNPPVLAPVGNRRVTLGQTLTFTLSASDPDGDPLTFMVSPLPLPAGATFNASTGVFSWRPAAAQVGTLGVVFSVSDGQLADSESVDLVVEGAPSGGTTELTGQVLDANDASQGISTPLVGATVRDLASGLSTVTDAQGNFLLSGIPSGMRELEFDGTTASGSVSYGSFRGPQEVMAGVRNVLDRPIFLMRLDPAGQQMVDPAAQTVVTNPNMGVTLTIPAGTAKQADGTDFAGMLTISEVPVGFTPSTLPASLRPSMVISIQPPGVTFSQPVPITFPNRDGLAPGSPVNLWGLDHTTGKFFVAGTGQVSADGSSINTVSGGVRQSSWHTFTPRSVKAVVDAQGRVIGLVIDGKFVAVQGGSSSVGERDGSLTIEHELPGIFSLNRRERLRFIYTSRTAHPEPVVDFDLRYTRFVGPPTQLSTRATVAGVDLGVELFTDTSSLDFATSEMFRQGLKVEAASLPTGVWPLRLTFTSHFGTRAALSTSTDSEILVHNEVGSPLGAGWGLDGLWRLHRQADGRALLTAGDGQTLLFTPAPRGDGGFTPVIVSGLTATASFLHVVATGDFNEDGSPDLLAAGVRVSGGRSVLILLNDGTGRFSLQGEVQPGGSLGNRMIMGDFTGDGHLDVALSTLFTQQVMVFAGDGNGNLAASPVVTALPQGVVTPKDLTLAGFQPEQFTGGQPVTGLLVTVDSVPLVAAADFNRDGQLDLVADLGLSVTIQSGTNPDVVRSHDGALILLGDGTGSFQIAPTGPLAGHALLSSVTGMSVHDFDGDGDPDLLLDEPSFVPGEQVRLRMLRGGGTGGFSPPELIASRTNTVVSGVPFSPLVGDFDGDGWLDLLVQHDVQFQGPSTWRVLFGSGTGLFASRDTVADLTLGSGETTVALGDFNGDLFLDLVTQTGIAFGRGDGEFDPPVQSLLVQNVTPGTRLVDDFNGDGRLDVVAFGSDRLSNRVDPTLFQGRGLSAFVSPEGDASLLVQNGDGSFTRTLEDGTRQEFDASGFHTATVDPFGNRVDYGYDTLGRLVTVTYPVNQTFAFSYGAGSVMITGPAGRITRFALDSSGNLTSITDPDGGVTRYQYDTRHRMTRYTAPGGEVYDYVRDRNGMIDRVMLPNGEVRDFDPSDAMGLPTRAGEGSSTDPMPLHRTADLEDRFTDGAGGARRLRTDRRGRVLQETNAAGDVTSWARGKNGDITTITRPNGSQVNLSYDDRGNLLTLDTSSGSNAFTWDANNTVRGITSPEGRTWQIGRDIHGAPISFTDSAGTTTRTLNAQGLPTTLTDALGNVQSYTYDASGNAVSLTDGLGHTTTFTRDAAGRVTQTTDAEGHVKSFGYDALNRVTSITDSRGRTTSYSYDAMSRLAQIQDAAGGAHTFSYNSVGQRTQWRNPAGEVSRYSFDVLRRLTSLTLPDARVIRYSYDPLRRLTGVDLPGGEHFSFSYNSFSRPTSMRTPQSSIRHTYDSEGRLIQSDFGDAADPAVVEPVATLSFSYDRDDNLVGEVDAEGMAGQWSWDGRERVTGFSNPEISHTFTHDAVGRLTGVASQISAGASGDMTRTLNAADQVTSVLNRVNGTVVSRFDIVTDRIGNRTQITDLAGNVSTYSYDADSQLIAATHAGQPDESYQYDALGNRVASHLDPGPALFDAANRILEDGRFTYTHDPQGNLTSRTDKATGARTDYSYNALNQLLRIEIFDSSSVRISLIDYTYDALGRRTSKSVDGVVTKYLWNQRDELVAEFDGNDQLLATYLYGPEPQMLLSMKRGGRQFLYQRDYLGSIIGVVDDAGALVDQYQYDSYGRIISESETVPNPFRFGGAQYDPESGLYYMKARYYDPELGRFLQPDPLAPASGLNPYLYVRNNPLSFIDEDGRFLVGGLIAGGINLATQGLDYALEDKTRRTPWWKRAFSFGFDVVVGAATCGASAALEAARGAQALTKLARFRKFLNVAGNKLLLNPVGQSFVGNVVKDAVTGDLSANTVRCFVVGAAFNKLGTRVTMELGGNDTAASLLVATSQLQYNMMKTFGDRGLPVANMLDLNRRFK